MAYDPTVSNKTYMSGNHKTRTATQFQTKWHTIFGPDRSEFARALESGATNLLKCLLFRIPRRRHRNT